MIPIAPGEFLRRVHEGVRPKLTLVTVPLLAEQYGATVSGGSGFLVQVADEAFLVTAAHVLAQYLEHGFRLYVPDTPQSAVTLAGEFVTPKDSERFDVGIVRLDPECEKALRAFGFSFLRSDQAREIDPRDPPPGGYVLLGFPDAIAEKKADGALAPEALYYSCTPWRGDPSDLPSLQFDASTHLTLKLEHDVRNTLTGEPAILPPLQGMSGCSIWHAYSPQHVDNPDAWNGDAPRLVAVQSSVFSSQGVVKAIPWTIVKRLMIGMWPELKGPLDLVPSNSALVREVLGGDFLRRVRKT